MKLTKNQEKSLDNFNKYGYLLVLAPRRSGKTELLKYIIKENSDKKIGVIAPVYDIARRIIDYSMENGYNCEPYKKTKKYDIIIGDEVFIDMHFNHFSGSPKIICAMTPSYKIDIWDEPLASQEDMKRIKEGLPELIFDIEYEQFKTLFTKGN